MTTETPADQLRDLITTAISKWHRDPEQPLYAEGADAVLAVFPAPALVVARRILGTTEHADTETAPTADRATVLREAADRYTTLADQNEAYDREHGELDETARIQYEAVRDVAAGLRRLAAEAQQPTPAPAEETK